MPRPPDLPAFYYHDHFMEMLGFCCDVYREILGDEERRFVEDFRHLSKFAQCLYIRMCNRKKAFFTQSTLTYAEIEDADAALIELERDGFLRRLSAEDYASILTCLTKADLWRIAAGAELTQVTKNCLKEKLSARIAADVPFAEFGTHFDMADCFAPARREALDFLLYLYFGKAGQTMTGFALRDLGIVSTHARQDFHARFDCGDEARAGFFYASALKRLKERGGAEAERLSAAADGFPAAATAYVAEMRDALFFTLGQYHEKRKDFAAALTLYGRAVSFECRERLVRLLYNSGRKDEAERVLSAMMADPESDEEHLFANDFFARKFDRKRLGIYSELLRGGEEIVVDDLFRGAPESAAIRHLEERHGGQGHHVENALWNTIFGLVFWEELHGRADAFSSAFDLMPRVLRDGSFGTECREAVAAKLAVIERGGAAAIADAAWDAYAGTQNALFGWYKDMREIVADFLTTAPAPAVASFLKLMAADYRGMQDGYPDLLMMNDRGVSFIEIKAEGDQIRRNQLARMRQLSNAGFDVSITRVAYRYDPEQDYVVVDIETTGGRPPFDRVTEIGAVRLRGQEIVGEWSSLINPERRIPAMITGLTGITNEMVAGAPTFADIAEDFAGFMEGAIFAAHNVNFDYGFIASEYQRLEQSFRFPKICTCASMRKYYPGHASYSLAKICADIGIGMERHHRALSDAKAAAELLKRVNIMREQKPEAQALKRVS